MRMKWREQLLAKTVLAGVASLGVPSMLAAGTVVFAPGAIAQTQTGSLRITVTGNTGAPVAGAAVKVSSPDSLTPKTGVSFTSVKATVPSDLRLAERSPISGMPVIER